MQFDFSEVEDVETFISVPEGEHLCQVAEVREGGPGMRAPGGAYA